MTTVEFQTLTQQLLCSLTSIANNPTNILRFTHILLVSGIEGIAHCYCFWNYRKRGLKFGQACWFSYNSSVQTSIFQQPLQQFWTRAHKGALFWNSSMWCNIIQSYSDNLTLIWLLITLIGTDSEFKMYPNLITNCFSHSVESILTAKSFARNIPGLVQSLSDQEKSKLKFVEFIFKIKNIPTAS